MRIRNREIDKVKKIAIKKMEPILYEIDAQERNFINSFNSNFEKVFMQESSPDKFYFILEELDKIPNKENIETRKVTIEVPVLDENKKEKCDELGNIIKETREFTIPVNIFQDFHKSYIKDNELRNFFEQCLTSWFDAFTYELKKAVVEPDTFENLMSYRTSAFALGSLAISAFHSRPHMILRDNQKMVGIAMSEGKIPELASGEGKTLSTILPTFLHSLRGKGAHVVTANNYLARRDFEETLPIFKGLGLTSGYVPENVEDLCIFLSNVNIDIIPEEGRILLEFVLKGMKREAYYSDITYASRNSVSFDYLHDSKVLREEDLVQRKTPVGFCAVDEEDVAAIDDARTPYRLSSKTKIYKKGMSLQQLCEMFNKSSKKPLDVSKLNIKDPNSLTFEEARYISVAFFDEELSEDPYEYQRLAEGFLSGSRGYLSKICILENNSYGFERVDDLFDAIRDDKKYRYVDSSGKLQEKHIADDIRDCGFGIVYCKENKKFRIFSECLEDFIKYCYKSGPIFSLIEKNKEKIINDPNYVESVDYYIDSEGRLRLKNTKDNKAIDRILEDPNYPDIVEDYQKYLTHEKGESALLFKYLTIAINAHCLLENGKDYIVRNGKIKLLKNGRVQEGSVLSGGLQLAVELKEKIEEANRTRETITEASITPKDLFGQYEVWGGTTATSDKMIMMNIYGKETVEIPRHAYYSYYGRRKVKGAIEPIGIDFQPTEFTRNTEDKINYICQTIIESQQSDPNRPFLIVVANPGDIPLLEKVLSDNGKKYNTLTAQTPAEKEAEIVARAGEPGAITITTEMAGRGTDIKVGGDRDTIINIHMLKRIEELKRQGLSFDEYAVREEVEKTLIDSGSIVSFEEEKENRKKLDKVGLTIISSGVHLSSRVDKQNEGRVGRNGQSGTIKRVICPSDLRRIGIISINGKDAIEKSFETMEREPSGKLRTDARTYNKFMDLISYCQKNYDLGVMRIIKDSQKLNSYSVKILDKYRKQRMKIICDEIDTDALVFHMITEITNAIMSSYIKKENLNDKFFTKPIRLMREGTIDFEAISLEINQTLGVSIDFKNLISNSDFNIVALIDLIVKVAKGRYEKLAKAAEENGEKLGIKAAIIQNDYISYAIPEILENCDLKRWIVSITPGSGEQGKALSEIEFEQSRRFLTLESYRVALSTIMGVALTPEEFKKVEEKREAIQFKKNIENDKSKEIIYDDNRLNIIDKIKKIKEEIARSKKVKNDNLLVRPFNVIKVLSRPCKFIREKIESIKNKKKMMKRPVK